jgi:hypothetical protein
MAILGGLASGGSFAGSRHGGHASLHFARHMRNDADHALDEHELGAVMHFVLFDAEEHFEPRFGGRRHAGRHGDLLAEEFVREAFKPCGKAITFGAQEGDNLVLPAPMLLFGEELAENRRKVETFERGAALHGVKLFLHSRHDGDVREHLGHGARIGRGVESVMLFADFLGDRHRVLPHGSKTGGEVFRAVISHICSLAQAGNSVEINAWGNQSGRAALLPDVDSNGIRFLTFSANDHGDHTASGERWRDDDVDLINPH